MVAEKLPLKGQREIVGCISILIELCIIFGLREKQCKWEGTIRHWQDLVKATGGDWMKVAKYKLAAFFSAHNQQPLPEPPFKVKDCPKQLFGGAAGKWIALVVRRGKDDDIGLMEFLTSILQSKKGMPRSDKSALRKAEEETIQKLTTWTKAARAIGLIDDWAEMDTSHPKVEATLSQLTWELQIRRTVRELYHKATFTAEERVKAFFPSTSANYIRSRRNAGALGEILEHPTLLKGLRTDGGRLRVEEEPGEMEEEGREEGRIYIPSDQREFDKSFETLWLRVLKEASTEQMFAQPVGLAEALKNRVITKGPPFVQTVLRALWKKMHSVLRKHRAFKLIGEPVSIEYLTDVLGSWLPEGKSYLSGDYADATNGLRGWASECAADEISHMLNLHPVERRLLINSLTRHKLVSKDKGEDMAIDQVTGQLMGSITSFPILCIINAAGTRWAMEVEEDKPILLRDLKAMFNGDDVAAVCGPKGYRLWKTIQEFVGLKESLGKTYFSDRFVNINSTNFITGPNYTFVNDVGKVRTTPFALTKYINMGLLTGKKRSEASISLNDEDDPYNRIGVQYRELIRNTPSGLIEKVHKTFLEHHGKLLAKARVPWYIPEWLGGLGLTGVGTPSDLDLSIARRILLNWKEERPIQLGRKEATWKTWQLASKAVPKPNYTEDSTDPGIQEYNNLVAKKCIDLMFDGRTRLDTLMQAAAKGKTQRAMNHNAKLWNPKPRGKKCVCRGIPQPLTKEELVFARKYETYSAPKTESPKEPQELD
jgi:hypothetical protein